MNSVEHEKPFRCIERKRFFLFATPKKSSKFRQLNSRNSCGEGPFPQTAIVQTTALVMAVWLNSPPTREVLACHLWQQEMNFSFWSLLSELKVNMHFSSVLMSPWRSSYVYNGLRIIYANGLEEINDSKKGWNFSLWLEYEGSGIFFPSFACMK